jgi:hypothetical protein
MKRAGGEHQAPVGDPVGITCRVGRELLEAAERAERIHLRRMPALERTRNVPTGGVRPAGMETRSEGGEP